MSEPPVSLGDIEAAAERLAGRVRRTPLIAAAPLADPPGDFELFLKLENLQITGSFKPRGATNCLLQLDPAQVARGVVTASGGNHGLGVAYAARQAGAPAVIYLPEGTPREKADKLNAWGAEVVVEGRAWNEANALALARAEEEGLAYLHAFADPRVIAGQGTVGLEILADAPDLDHVIVAIGGGSARRAVGAASAARASSRVNQSASSISKLSTWMSRVTARARQPSMSEAGNGQGWLLQYDTSPTLTPNIWRASG